MAKSYKDYVEYLVCKIYNGVFTKRELIELYLIESDENDKKLIAKAIGDYYPFEVKEK